MQATTTRTSARFKAGENRDDGPEGSLERIEQKLRAAVADISVEIANDGAFALDALEDARAKVSEVLLEVRVLRTFLPDQGGMS